MKKGQTTSVEILMAVIVFLVLLTITMTIWQNKNEKIQEEFQIQEMQLMGSRALDYIVRSPGEAKGTLNPTNWEDYPIDNVLFIGLAKSPGIIDSKKLLKFVKYGDFDSNPAGYEKTKAKLLLTGDFNYYFRLTNTVDLRIILANAELCNPPRETSTIIEQQPSGPVTLKTGKAPDTTSKTYQAIALKRIVSYESPTMLKEPQCGQNAYSGAPAIEFLVYKQ